MDYADYQHLAFERRPNGVVLVTINRPEVLNATNDRLHWELTQIWLTLDADASARVAVVTGAGRAFSAGGDLAMVDANSSDSKRLARTMREASDIVYNMINLDKPVISAINGVAVGAALAPYLDNRGQLPHRIMRHAYLGPEFDDETVEATLKTCRLRHARLDDPAGTAAELLAKMCGWNEPEKLEHGASNELVIGWRDAAIIERMRNPLRSKAVAMVVGEKTR